MKNKKFIILKHIYRFSVSLRTILKFKGSSSTILRITNNNAGTTSTADDKLLRISYKGYLKN